MSTNKKLKIRIGGVQKNSGRKYILKAINIYLLKIIFQKQKKEKMNHKYESRKFHRSPKMMSPTSCSIIPSTVSYSRQYMSPTPRNYSECQEDNANNNDKDFSFSLGNIFGRLDNIQRQAQQEKQQRERQYVKLVKMIKEMECKHTSIIYDSQIKYLKPAFKAQFSNVVLKSPENNESEKTLKKVSSYVFDKNHFRTGEQQNQAKKPSENAQKSQTNTTSLQQINKIQSSRQIKSNIQQNPQKSKVSSQPNGKLSVAQLDIEQLTKTLVKKLQPHIMDNVNKIKNREKEQNQQKLLQISRRIKQVQESIKSNEALNRQQINSVMASQQQLQKGFQQLSKNFSQYSLNLSKEIQNIENKTKSNISLLASQLNQKVKGLQKVSQNNSSQLINGRVDAISKSFQQLIGKLSRIEKQNEQKNNFNTIKLADVQKQLLSKIEENTQIIVGVENYLQLKDREQQNQKLIRKNQQLEKAKQNDKLMVKIDSLLQDRIQNSKRELSKQMIKSYEKVEDQLLGIIQRHIIYIENFIKKTQQKQDFIMKKFFDETQINVVGEGSKQSSGEPVSTQNQQFLLSKIEQRYHQFYSILKQQVEILTNRDNQLQSSVRGVIEALNQVVSQVNQLK